MRGPPEIELAPDLEARGDFLDHEYAFERGGRTVATVSKQWFRLTDTYGVEITGGDDVLVLASAVVIDMVCHEESNEIEPNGILPA